MFLVKRDELVLSGEEEILMFEAIMHWGKYRLTKENKDENNVRLLQQKCENLLNWVRFPLMTSDQLAKIVEPSQLVSQQLLFEAYKFHLVKHSLPPSTSVRFKHRAGSMMQQQQQTPQMMMVPQQQAVFNTPVMMMQQPQQQQQPTQMVMMQQQQPQQMVVQQQQQQFVQQQPQQQIIQQQPVQQQMVVQQQAPQTPVQQPTLEQENIDMHDSPVAVTVSTVPAVQPQLVQQQDQGLVAQRRSALGNITNDKSKRNGSPKSSGVKKAQQQGNAGSPSKTSHNASAKNLIARFNSAAN